MALTKATGKRQSATLKKVADAAGVSLMAVSVVLNKTKSNTRVSSETRARIEAVALEIGYVPNALARSLRQGRTQVVGFYSGHASLNARYPFLAEVIGGIQDGCDEIRSDLLLFGKFRGNQAEDVFASLIDGRVDGLVVHAPLRDPLVEHLVGSRLPVIAIVDAIEGIPSVVADDLQGGRMQAEFVHSKGHRKILYRGTTQAYSSVRRREAAFRKRAIELGIKVLDGRLTTNSLDEDFTSAERTLIGKGQGSPSAIVTWSDEVAEASIASVVQLGLRVPEDVAVIGFDGIERSFYFRSPLTTIRAPWNQVARTAVLKLADLVAGRHVETETVLPIELIPGETA